MKDKILNLSQAWDKGKIWVVTENQTHDIANTRRALY